VHRLPPLGSAAAAAGAAALAVASAWALARPPAPIVVAARAEAGTASEPLAGEAAADLGAEAMLAPVDVAPRREDASRPARAAATRALERRRRARRGSELWYRLEFEEIAAVDPSRFAEVARERLEAEGELVEKIALLRVARRGDAALADELWTDALTSTRAEGLPDAALVLLEASADASADVRRRLVERALLDPRVRVDLRRRAALAVAKRGDEALLEFARRELDEVADAELLAALDAPEGGTVDAE
jgi:hypothetical protein